MAKQSKPAKVKEEIKRTISYRFILEKSKSIFLIRNAYIIHYEKVYQNGKIVTMRSNSKPLSEPEIAKLLKKHNSSFVFKKRRSYNVRLDSKLRVTDGYTVTNSVSKELNKVDLATLNSK